MSDESPSDKNTTSALRSKRRRNVSFPTGAELSIAEDKRASELENTAERASHCRDRSQRKHLRKSVNHYIIEELKKLKITLDTISDENPNSTSLKGVYNYFEKFIWALGPKCPDQKTLDRLKEIDPLNFLGEINDMFEEHRSKLNSKLLSEGGWAIIKIDFIPIESKTFPKFQLKFYWPQIEVKFCDDKSHLNINIDSSFPTIDEHVSIAFGIFAKQEIPTGTKFPWYGLVTDIWTLDISIPKGVKETIHTYIKSHPIPSYNTFGLPLDINPLCHMHSPSKGQVPNMVFFETSRVFVADRNIRKGEELTAFISSEWKKNDFRTMRYISLCQRINDDDRESSLSFSPL